MDELNDIPSSKNLARLDAKEYWVTAAEWNSPYGSSYEIGVRNKRTEAFELLQNRWTKESVVQAANAVVLMLNEGFSVETVRRVISP